MRGDLDFERLVQEYHVPLYRFALSLARNENDAADLVQQTFYLWAGKGHQLEDPTKVKSWLFTTLHREFLAKRRRLVRFARPIRGEESGLTGDVWRETRGATS